MKYENIWLLCNKGDSNKYKKYSLSEFGFPYDVQYGYNTSVEHTNLVVDEFVYLIHHTLATKIGDLHRWFDLTTNYEYKHMFSLAYERYIEQYYDQSMSLEDCLAHRTYELYKEGYTLHDLYYKTCITHKMLNEIFVYNKYNFDLKPDEFDLEIRFYKAKDISYKKNYQADGYNFDVLFYKDDKPYVLMDYRYHPVLKQYSDYTGLDADEISDEEYNKIEEDAINGLVCFDVDEWIQSFDDKKNYALEHGMYYFVVDDITYELGKIVDRLYQDEYFASECMNIYEDKLRNKIDSYLDEKEFYLCDVEVKGKNKCFCYLSKEGMIPPLTRVKVPLKDEILEGVVLTCEVYKQKNLPLPVSKLRYIISREGYMGFNAELTFEYDIRYKLEQFVLPGMFYKYKKEFVDSLLNEINFFPTLLDQLHKERNIFNVSHPYSYTSRIIHVNDRINVVQISNDDEGHIPLAIRIYLFYDNEFDKMFYFIVERATHCVILCGLDEDLKHLCFAPVHYEDESIELELCLELYGGISEVN